MKERDPCDVKTAKAYAIAGLPATVRRKYLLLVNELVLKTCKDVRCLTWKGISLPATDSCVYIVVVIAKKETKRISTDAMQEGHIVVL
jgi:hypothetical protein